MKKLEEKSTTGKELGTSLLGIITTVITVGACSWIEINWNLLIYSFMFWFIIPVGAVGAGFVAASGYYFGAQVLHLPVSGRLTFNIVFASIASFFLVYYIPYYFYETNGVLIREQINFLNYLDIILTKTSYSLIRFRGSTGEVGSWGYGIAFLQFFGFTSAGLAISNMLKEKPYCNECSKYYSKKYSRSVYSSEPETTAKNFNILLLLMRPKFFNKIGSAHKEMGPGHSAGHHLSLDFEILQCDCKNNYLSLMVKKKSGDDWDPVKGLNMFQITKEKIPLKYK